MCLIKGGFSLKRFIFLCIIKFNEVVSRVATKGGITEEGVKVVNEEFPAIAETIFLRTLEKRRLTAQKAEELF